MTRAREWEGVKINFDERAQQNEFDKQMLTGPCLRATGFSGRARLLVRGHGEREKVSQMHGSTQWCVCETDPHVSPLHIKCYVTGRPRLFSFFWCPEERVLLQDCKFYLLPRLVVYLFQHVSCILYIVVSQSVLTWARLTEFPPTHVLPWHLSLMSGMRCHLWSQASDSGVGLIRANLILMVLESAVLS